MKDMVNKSYLSNLEIHHNEKNSTHYINNKYMTIDHYNTKSHLWWLKVRTEGIFLAHRDTHCKMCPCCKNTIETLEHFLLECTSLQSTSNNRDIYQINASTDALK